MLVVLPVIASISGIKACIEALLLTNIALFQIWIASLRLKITP